MSTVTTNAKFLGYHLMVGEEHGNLIGTNLISRIGGME